MTDDEEEAEDEYSAWSTGKKKLYGISLVLLGTGM